VFIVSCTLLMSECRPDHVSMAGRRLPICGCETTGEWPNAYAGRSSKPDYATAGCVDVLIGHAASGALVSCGLRRDQDQGRSSKPDSSIHKNLHAL